MMQTPGLTPRKQPQQGRSRATYEAILQACTQLLDRGGVAAVTTNALAERAGVSVGSLYQYFPSKEAVLASLVRELRQQMLQDLQQVLDRPDLASLPREELVLALITASLQHHIRNPVLAQRLEQVEEALPMAAEEAEVKQRINAPLVTILAEFGAEHPEVAAREIVVMCSAIAQVAVKTGEQDFDALARRLCRAVMGYLGWSA